MAFYSKKRVLNQNLDFQEGWSERSGAFIFEQITPTNQ